MVRVRSLDICKDDKPWQGCLGQAFALEHQLTLLIFSSKFHRKLNVAKFPGAHSTTFTITKALILATEEAPVSTNRVGVRN